MKIKNLIKSITLLSAIFAISATTSCTPTTSTTADTSFPVAKPVLDETGQPKKDLFISPYSPYNPIDTRGYKSGDVVGDPSTAGIGKESGKPVLSTSKAFRIP